jgi:hypothetical protein
MTAWWILLSTVICFTSSVAHATDAIGQRVRKLYLRRDEIAQVKTAVGIATLIQVPDRPTSVVLGDMNAFKVEYLENAITIKPLSRSSKSNLYIYTESRRFNVSLTTTPLLSADYIVYLEPERPPAAPEPEPIRERWREFVTERESPDFRLRTSRVGTMNGFLLVEFTILAPKSSAFRPDWIWLKQSGKTVPIQRLSLSAIEATPDQPIQGLIAIKRTEVRAGPPVVLEVRAPTPIKLKLPEVRSWLRSS